MLDFPNDDWFHIRKSEQQRDQIVYGGMNLFAIWQKDCGVPDKPCPPGIDPRIWNSFYPYLNAWNILSKSEKQIWHDVAFTRLGFYKVIE